MKNQLEPRYNATILQRKWWLGIWPLLWCLGVCSSFLFRPMSFTPTQTVVFFFEFIGPYWPITFGLAFILLFLAILREQYIELAMYISMGVSFGLFVATMFGVATGGGWVGATAAFVMSGISLTMGHLFRWERK